MRKILLLLLSVCPMWGMAKQISVSSAEKIAAKYVNTPLFAKGVNRSPVLKSMTEKGIDEYYIFNIGDGGGYVIVSGDDEMTELVGYSDSGNIDSDNMPENMRRWLDEYAGYVRYVQSSGADAGKRSLRSVGTPVVDSFMDVHYNQGEPYNEMCPVYNSSDGYRCPTGCVATAMAMVMKYYEWPDVGVGSHSYSSNYGVLSSDFSSHYYDWKNMKTEYTSYYDSNWNIVNDWTEAEASAVAQLMYDCGVSVEMMYSSEESGAYTVNMLNALKNNFKYNAKNIDREGLSTAEFRRIIKQEMDARRPVLFSGNGSVGHEFVIDGYDSNDFLHVNWGWGGMSDGFFDMNYMNPDNIGTGGGTGGFAYSHSIVVLSPNRSGYEPEREQLALLYNTNDGRAGGIYTDQTEVATTSPLYISLNYVWNANYEAWKGSLGVGIFDENGKILGVTQKSTKGLDQWYYFSSVSFSIAFASDFANIGDGRYYLYGISKEEYEGMNYDWIKISSMSNIEIVIKDGSITVVPPSGNIVGNQNVVCPEHSRLGFSSNFIISLHNNYDRTIQGELYWTIVKKSAPDYTVYSGSQKAIIYDNSDFEDAINVYFSPTNYNIGEEYIFKVESVDGVPVENCQGEFVIDNVRPQQTLLFRDYGDGKSGLHIPVEKFEKSIPQTVVAAYIANMGTETWNGVWATGLYDEKDNLLSVTETPFEMTDFGAYNEIGEWEFNNLSPDMTGVADGKYRIFMISKEQYGNENYDWVKIEGDDGVEVEVRGDWVYVTENSGVASLVSDNIKLYPNPVADYLIIECLSELKSVEVYNMSGAVVARAESDRVDMSGLTSGSYVVAVSTEEGVTYHHVLKQ